MEVKSEKKLNKMKKGFDILCSTIGKGIWKIEEMYLDKEHLAQFSKDAIIGNQ